MLNSTIIKKGFPKRKELDDKKMYDYKADYVILSTRVHGGCIVSIPPGTKSFLMLFPKRFRCLYKNPQFPWCFIERIVIYYSNGYRVYLSGNTLQKKAKILGRRNYIQIPLFPQYMTPDTCTEVTHLQISLVSTNVNSTTSKIMGMETVESYFPEVLKEILVEYVAHMEYYVACWASKTCL